MLSIIVPAHNEESVICRCLELLLGGTSSPSELEVIVVANGCTDRTAELARGFDGVRVLELAEASKHKALNAGDAVASHFPRAFVDADIEVTGDALLAVARAMSTGEQLAGAPRLEFDLTECSWAVRSYLRVWSSLAWSREAPIGGVYVLSAAGRERVGEFPAVTNDDQYVHDMFELHERLCLDSESFVVRPPRNLRALVRVRTRTLAGQREMEEQFGPMPGRTSGPPPTRLLAENPRLAGDIFVFALVKVLASVAVRQKARTSRSGWERDDTSRRLVGGA